MDIIEKNQTSLPYVVSERTADTLKESLSDNTKRAYRSDLLQFAQWLTLDGRPTAPVYDPGTVADYLTFMDEQDKAMATIERHTRAICWAHRVKAEPSPTQTELVKSLLKAIRRKRVKEKRPTASTSKAPATVDVIRAMLMHCQGKSLLEIRDRAILLVGFSGALRRSELVALQSEDIRINGKGADLFIASSKTDQYGRGEIVSIMRSENRDTCPVLALVDWFNASGITVGSAFCRIRRGNNIQESALSDKSVADIIKKYCHLAGLKPFDFSGHSLRSGMLTSAAEAGADLITLAQHARHKSTNTTMHYIRHANRYKNNPTEGLL